MEHLEGEDLASRLERHGPQREEDVAGWIIEACAALDVAHRAGIVHRDLKPANLFLATRGDGSTCVKILDFGISKMLSVSKVTQTATTVGTPLYMSPEQVSSASDVDARSDIWSLGVILYELVSGRLPFEGTTPIQVAMKACSTEPTPLSSVAPNVSNAFAEIVHRCLAKAPADRFQDVVALVGALAELAPDARHIAARLDKQASDPALMATAQDAPSLRDLSAGTGNAAVPKEEAIEPAAAVGQATLAPTLAPTHASTSDAGRTRPPRAIAFVAGGVALAIAVTVAFAASRGRDTRDPIRAASTTTSATSDPSSITPPPPAKPTPVTPVTAVTAVTSATSAEPQASAVPTSTARAPRPVHVPVTASGSAASALPSTTPTASVIATPTDPTSKKRKIDRDDPF